MQYKQEARRARRQQLHIFKCLWNIGNLGLCALPTIGRLLYFTSLRVDFFTYNLGLNSIFSFLLTYLILVLYSTSLLGPIFAKSANFLLFSQTSFASLLVFVFWRSFETRKTSRFTCFCFFEESEWEKRLLTIKDRHLPWLAFKGGAWAGGGGLMGKREYLNLKYLNQKNLKTKYIWILLRNI